MNRTLASNTHTHTRTHTRSHSRRPSPGLHSRSAREYKTQDVSTRGATAAASKRLQVRESPETGPFVVGLRKVPVTCRADVERVLDQADSQRAVALARPGGYTGQGSLNFGENAKGGAGAAHRPERKNRKGSILAIAQAGKHPGGDSAAPSRRDVALSSRSHMIVSLEVDWKMGVALDALGLESEGGSGSPGGLLESPGPVNTFSPRWTSPTKSRPKFGTDALSATAPAASPLNRVKGMDKLKASTRKLMLLNKMKGSVPGPFTTRLQMYDLVGTESVKRSDNARVKEGALINKSIASLNHVVEQLFTHEQKRKRRVPSGARGAASDYNLGYRDSVLTWLLKPAFSGSAVRTTVLAMVRSEKKHEDETVKTLQFASRWRSLNKGFAITPTIDPKVTELGLEAVDSLQGTWLARIQMQDKAFTVLKPAPVRPSAAAEEDGDGSGGDGSGGGGGNGGDDDTLGADTPSSPSRARKRQLPSTARSAVTTPEAKSQPRTSRLNAITVSETPGGTKTIAVRADSVVGSTPGGSATTDVVTSTEELSEVVAGAAAEAQASGGNAADPSAANGLDTPSGSQRHQVKLKVVLEDMDISGFTDDLQAAFKDDVARIVGVGLDQIHLTIAPGSVHINVAIRGLANQAAASVVLEGEGSVVHSQRIQRIFRDQLRSAHPHETNRLTNQPCTFTSTFPPAVKQNETAMVNTALFGSAKLSDLHAVAPISPISVEKIITMGSAASSPEPPHPQSEQPEDKAVPSLESKPPSMLSPIPATPSDTIFTPGITSLSDCIMSKVGERTTANPRP